MTLLKDNNYKDINIALLSLENDIKNRIANFDTSAIDKQLAEINERIDGINAGSGSSSSSGNSSAEINDLRAEVENIDVRVSNNSNEIANINTKLSNIFSAESYIEDFNTVTEPGIYWWGIETANRPNNYGVLLVYAATVGNSNWINQIAYSTSDKIYFRQKINDNEWRDWKTIAFEDITKTYTIPDVTTATTRYIKLGTFPWNFSEKVKVVLSGNNFEDTVEFNVLGGNGKNSNVCGWYTTNSAQTKSIIVVPVTPGSSSSNIEVWLQVTQATTLTVKLIGNAKAAQYFNTNPQMNNTQTAPSGVKATNFSMGRGFFGYNENSLNCYETTMVGLGFAKDQVVSVAEFAQALINYTGTKQGQVYFQWTDANRAYIKATAPYNTQLEINGGTLVFRSRYKNINEAWGTFEAEYIDREGNLYTLTLFKDSSTITEYVRKEVDTSTTSVLRKNVDAGYLCKHYDISGHTNQAYNVILLGKIPDPASTAAPATPSTSWDIDVDFYFVRSQGHKAAWCNVKAGYGYSNAWRKYAFIETFGVDTGSNYTNPFVLVTLKYNNEWYIGVRHFVNIDGNYAARVHNVNIASARNPSTVANTPLANMLKAIGYKKNDNTVLNSEINGSIVNFDNNYAPTIERNSSLVISNTTDVALNSFGNEPLSIGTVTGDNLGIDSNEIQARFNGAAAPLYINGSGGKVNINDTGADNGGLRVGGNTTLQSNTSVSLSNFGKEPLSIGAAAGKNIGIDGDDIQARNNGAAATLDLNYLGGTVRVNGYGNANGGLQVSGHLNIPTSAPSNPVKGDIWLVL